MFDCDPKLPLDYLLGVGDDVIDTSHTKFYSKLRNNIKYCAQLAEIHTKGMKEKGKEYYYYDLRTRGQR